MVPSNKHIYFSIVWFSVHSCDNCFVFVTKDGRTALMRASDKGHTNVVQSLLSVGAQVDWQDKVRHSISLQNAND